MRSRAADEPRHLDLDNTLMSILARLLMALVLLAVAGFCVLGFLVTLEPPGAPILRLVYAAVGLACLVGVGPVITRLGKARSPE